MDVVNASVQEIGGNDGLKNLCGILARLRQQLLSIVVECLEHEPAGQRVQLEAYLQEGQRPQELELEFHDDGLLALEIGTDVAVHGTRPDGQELKGIRIRESPKIGPPRTAARCSDSKRDSGRWSPPRGRPS